MKTKQIELTEKEEANIRRALILLERKSISFEHYEKENFKILIKYIKKTLEK